MCATSPRFIDKVSNGSVFSGTLRFPIPAVVLDLAGDSNLNFNSPSLPGTVTISGKVTDGLGRGIGGVFVDARSESVTNAPGARLSNSSMTDENGSYSFSVLSGTNYEVTFTPPLPGP
jgi:hypothetical protein